MSASDNPLTPSPTDLPGQRVIKRLSGAFAWVFPILMVAIVAQVFLRKAGMNQAWLDDLQWWLYGSAMMVGFAFAIATESHVRVDILHAGYSPAKKARIEVFALGWLLLPFLAVMTDLTLHYALASIAAKEGSDSPNGLHHLYILKTAVPILFMAAIAAAWSGVRNHLKTLGFKGLSACLIGALPFVWFVCERVAVYGMWWGVRVSNAEIKPRSILKEPIFDLSAWYGLALFVILLVLTLIWDRQPRAHKDT